MEDTLIPLFSDREIKRLSFSGQGPEYFRIWIVNVALTIVTLGIYSAWAKVRRQQYFYRHTTLSDTIFDYHGSPIAILKGRIVALVLFLLYTATGFVQPLAAVVIFAVIALALPWLLMKSLQFKLRNTSYRGLRFRFTGTSRAAYATFVGYGLLALVTFGLAAPLWYQRIKQYQHGNAAYGQTGFSMTATAGDVYKACIGVALAAFVSVCALFIFAMLLAGLGAALGLDTSQRTQGAVIAVVGLIVVVYLLLIIAIRCLMIVRLRNLIWTQTRIGDHRLTSDLELRPFMWIELTNILLLLCTLGLYRPFAQIRSARYLLQATAVEVSGSLDEFRAADAEDPSAIGSEVAGFFDLDIAF